MQSITPTPTQTQTIAGTPVADIYEDDDIPSQAKIINTGEIQSRSIENCNENDWIKFTLTETSDVEIITETNFSTYIEVFDDENKTNYIGGAGDGQGPASAFLGNLIPGTYYSNIRAYNYESPGCDIFYYTLKFNIYIKNTPTQTETSTYMPSPTFTATATYTYTHTQTATFTETDFFTSTFTHSYTPTFTPTFDNYEYDGTTFTAKPISNGETQYRNLWLQGDADYISFNLPAHSLLSFDIRTTGYYNVQIMNQDGATVSHPVSGFLTYIKTGDFLLETDLLQGNYFFYIHNYASEDAAYSVSFNYTTCTFTNTPTNTMTNTFTIIYTFTNTYTPTQTSTPFWDTYGQYGFNNSGYLCFNSNGSDFAFSYMNAGTLYVDTGYSITTSAEGGFLASRDMIKKRGNETLLVYSNYNADIFLKNSFNFTWTANIGRGYYPCIDANSTTIFVAYTDIEGETNMRTSVKYSTDGINWYYFGGDGGVYDQPDTTPRRLSMDGYFYVNYVDIYVAYIIQANAGIYIKHNDDSGSGWQQVGDYVVYASNIKDVEIDVIDPSNIFCAYSTNVDFKILVKKFEAGNWVYAGTNPVAVSATAGNAEFSLYAVSPDEVYLAYQHPDNTKLVVKKYNGSDWEYLGNFNGITDGQIANPNIFKVNNILYCGFIDYFVNGLITLMQYGN